MKRVLLGVAIGLVLGWLTVPIVRATYLVSRSDETASVLFPINEDDDFRASHAYKWYLTQILSYIKDVDKHLASIDENIKAVKDKLHA